MMGKKSFVRLTSLIVVILLTGHLAFAQKMGHKRMPKKAEFIDFPTNYVINLVVNSENLKEEISFVVASKNFSIVQYFPNAVLTFEGTLKQKDNSIFAIINYKLGLREKIINKNDIEKSESSQWVDSGCINSIVLTENKQITIFKSTNRSYKIKISKLKEER